MVCRQKARQPDRTGPRPAREAGFTLLELLVAITVLAMIATTAFGALRLGVRSWEAGVNRANETETLRAVAGMLRRQFNQVVPLVWIEDTRRRLAFSGSRSAVRFIAPAPQRLGDLGLIEFMLTAERQADTGRRLVLSYRAFDPEATSLPAPRPGQRRVLVEDLHELAFAFYGTLGTGGEPGWYSHWPANTETYPRLVHVQLEAREGEAEWPVLLFTLPGRPGQ